MATPSQEPEPLLTNAQIDAWLHGARLKRRQLLFNGTESSQSERTQTFLDMGTLCLDALEEVRVMSAQLREDSQVARFQSQDIVADSARLLAKYTTFTDSQILQILKGDQNQRAKPE